MRLKLKKEDLNKGLQAVQKVAQNKNNNMSSENGLLIKALHGIIEFQANDYDMGIKITVPGIIEEKGEAFIANPYLMDLTRRIPSDEIEIIKADTDTQLLIKGDKLKFECLTINPDDFNEVEIVENGYASFKTTSVVLKDLIDNTSYACATDVARPIFMGTFLDVQGDQMTMVATDTHRLALKKTTLDQPVDNPLQAVIPSRLLSEISRRLENISEVEFAEVLTSRQDKKMSQAEKDKPLLRPLEFKSNMRPAEGVRYAKPDPLVMIDGVEYTGGLDKVDPNEIESISIMKDKSAIEMYGKKAVGGVILITTKKASSKVK